MESSSKERLPNGARRIDWCGAETIGIGSRLAERPGPGRRAAGRYKGATDYPCLLWLSTNLREARCAHFDLVRRVEARLELRRIYS